MALRLNYERLDLGAVAQEVRRRTFWSLYLLEDIFCVGLKEFELCRPDIIQLQLPCADTDFEGERLVTTGCLRPDGGREPETINDRGLFLRLAYIRRAIMRLNRRVYLKEIDSSELVSSIRNFETKLQQCQTQIRPFDQFTPDDPVPYHVRPQTVMCHMSLHQCYCDLYRMFLAGYTDAVPQVDVQAVAVKDRMTMRTKCLENAEKIVQTLIDFSEQSDKIQVLDSDAAVCAYHGTRLVLFGACSPGGNPRLPMQLAIKRAKACLSILSRLFAFSHSVKPMLKDLDGLIQRYDASLAMSYNVEIAEEEDSLSHEREVSEHARVRQRLSVHSLLLQAGFVDDSRDAADSFAEDACLAANLEESRVSREEPGSRPADGQRSYSGMISPEPLLLSQELFPDMQQGNANLLFNAWMGFPGPDELSGVGSALDDEF
ncbi:uncharacterized protein A1O5_02310 [Cladophialophora psammophila CBS 110553]|uniref:Xylanolytic transcriptional activator regulatory domain-containing protein n=1 Tax=Cladophialophora psammophila CBS 110553 TaxID=1182543 RepID=W9XAS3_9EURO|nr:uncharacterized protein A1O5_02310 [Cladophialophora psammophila CBS 110553]EXJ74016.1 hypothetical protein A1O5_02310 [Cladophialophora psammophila CBS 110553]